MRKLLIPSALLATAFACPPLALAGMPPAAGTSTAKATSSHPDRRHHHRMHHRGHGMHAFKQLDLTESQRSSIHKLMRDNLQQARAGRDDLHRKHEALREATPGTAAYQSAASALAEAAASAARSRVMRRADLHAKIHDLLTAEQRTKLADIRAQRHARMEKWRASHQRHMARPATASSAE